MNTLANPLNIIFPKNINGMSGISLNNQNNAVNMFADILEKELNSMNSAEQPNNMFQSMGIPAGFDIQEFNPTEFSHNKVTDAGDISQSGCNLLDYARKQAANFYGKHSGSVVTDLSEFVFDALKK